MPRSSDPESPANAETQRLWRLAAMGGTLASEIIAGAIIGWLLDKLFGTAPVLVIVFTVCGVVVGMVTFIRIALRESRQAGRNARQVAERHHHQPPEAPGAMNTSPLDRRATLPLAALLAAVWAGCAVVGGLWAGVVWIAGRGTDLAVTGLLGAAVVGVAATLVLLGLRPWRPKPLSRWPSVWVAGSFLRLLLTLGGAFLLYSATPYRSRALWLAVVLAYLAVLVGETRVYALSMRRFAPVAGGPEAEGPSARGTGPRETGASASE